MSSGLHPSAAAVKLPPASNISRKRVCIFASCDSFEGFYGGTFGLNRKTFLETYRNDFVWQYAAGLRNCGHEVYIYYLSYGPPALHPISDGLAVRFVPLPAWARWPDRLLFRLRNIRHIPSLRDRIAHLAYEAVLQDALLDDGVQVLYHQEIWTPRFDYIVRKATVPVIGADHGAVYASWMAKGKSTSLKMAAGLVCQSLVGTERVRNFGADAVLMYNGTDTEFFAPPSSDRTRGKNVLAVGRFVEAQKRFADLLRAMQLLPDFTLTLVGSGADEAKLKKLAVELGIENRVVFTGFISDREELRNLYQSCGVFVSTSSWEAVALVMLEAMSCGAPVVATRIPSFEELLTDGVDGLLVPIGSPEAVAAAALQAYLRRDELGINARQTVQAEYSSSAVFSQLSNMVESIS